MLRPVINPQPNAAQLKAINDYLKNNPSLKSTYKYGFYSNGTVLIEVAWIFAEDVYSIGFNTEGELTTSMHIGQKSDFKHWEK